MARPALRIADMEHADASYSFGNPVVEAHSCGPVTCGRALLKTVLRNKPGTRKVLLPLGASLLRSS